MITEILVLTVQEISFITNEFLTFFNVVDVKILLFEKSYEFILFNLESIDFVLVILIDFFKTGF